MKKLTLFRNIIATFLTFVFYNSLLAQYNTCSTAWNLPYISDDTWTQSTLGVASDNASSGALTCGLTLGTGGQKWYKFTWEDCTSQITLDTSNPGTNFDTQIHVYTGTCGNFSCVGSDDDSGTGTTSMLTITVQQNVTYTIRVGGYNNASGTFVFKVTVGTGGCTDPNACNYNPNADWNNCSCVYNPASFSLSGNSSSSPGSYVYITNGIDVLGTLQPGESINFCGEGICHLQATFYLGNNQTSWGGVTYTVNLHGSTYTGNAGNGSDWYYKIDINSPACGCTDPTALNYDPSATEDAQNCEQDVPGSSCANAQMVSVPSATFIDLSTENYTFEPSFGVSFKTKWIKFEYPGGVLSIELAPETFGDAFMMIFDECGETPMFTADDYYIPNGYSNSNPRKLLSCADGLIKGETYLLQAYGLSNNINVIADIRFVPFYGCTDPLASNYNACASNDDGSCETCPADIDNSGFVNIADLLQFVSAYGSTCN